jgi:HPt (histidine-containing phosphotransfer) domain-containing protein
MKAREEGRSLDDIGVFEIDLIENRVVWANEFAIDKSGYTLDQVKHMTLLDLTPSPFHSEVQTAIANTADRKHNAQEETTSVWPMLTSGGKVTWWAVIKTTIEFPLVWIHGDHVQTTGVNGMSYAFMRAFMRAANGQTGLSNQIAELKAWTSNQIDNLNSEDKRLHESLTSLESKLTEALAATKESAASSKTSIKMIDGLQRTFQDLEAKYGAEILKLIGTDVVHDKRIDAFEQHMKITAELAVQSIQMQAKTSSDGLAKQAKESSKGLSRRIVIPMSVIAAVVTIIQILLEKFLR